MTPLELLEYYANLLLMQYKSKPKARAMIKALASLAILPQTSVQKISFSLVPTHGSFKLAVGTHLSSAIAWDASASAIELIIQALPGLSAITVTGSIASQELVVTMNSVVPPAALLIVASNTLYDGTPASVDIEVEQIDVTLPQAIQQAYNLDTAVGVQLDLIGKYCGVIRQGYNFSDPMTLTDDQFRFLIKLAIVQNNSGSALADIQDQIFKFFPGALFVFDYGNMRMSYSLNSSIANLEFIEFIIKGNHLPRPMGVQLGGLIFAPDLTVFFGFRTAVMPAFNNVGFNDTSNSYPGSWLSALENGIFI